MLGFAPLGGLPLGGSPVLQEHGEVVVPQPPLLVNSGGGSIHGPPYRPKPQPIDAVIETGQGGQSVSARGRVVTAVTASADQSAIAEMSITMAVSGVVQQAQSGKSHFGLRMTGSIRVRQAVSCSEANVGMSLVAVVKAGGDAPMNPTYDGDPVPPEEFIVSETDLTQCDRAA